MNDDIQLTPEQQAMVALWETHTRCEFEAHDVDATMATMTATPYLNHVPVMTGGQGAEAVRRFYGSRFIPGQPPDTEIVFLRRTVGQNRIVDELIHKFTHTIEMPWILPGVAPSGKRVELAVCAVVEFEDGKIASEHIYWDQGSLLVQLGLIKAEGLPVVGIEQARKRIDPALPSNTLIDRAEGAS